MAVRDASMGSLKRGLDSRELLILWAFILSVCALWGLVLILASP